MTEKDQRSIDVVRRLYLGDEAERARIARDMIWHVPGHNPVSGDYHGYDAYTQALPAKMAPLDLWDFMLEAVMVNGSSVMTTYRLQAERRGIKIDLRGGHLIRLSDDGMVVEGWDFTDRQDELDAFFSA